MRRSRQLLPLAIGITVILSSCGYFNSLYNARRQFAQGQRAAERGDVTAAQAGYTGAIEKAAKSYRKYPDGRWSDDALHLIARARFELREFSAARAASAEILEKSTDSAIRGDAHAIFGASAFEQGDREIALLHLDSAVEQAGSQLRGRAHLWRARARRAAGDAQGAWADLATVQKNDPAFAAVQLERIALGIEQRDSAQTAAGFKTLLLHRDARQWVDTLSGLALRAVSAFGASSTRDMLNADFPDWLAAARDSVALLRAELALRGGDTLTATTELTQLTSRSAAIIANRARLTLARAQLHQANELQDLRDVRALLLPAITDAQVQLTLRRMSIAEALVQKAQTSGQPLALFAAAEIARDELEATGLARRLFITFVDVAPQTPWAAKALLAALALAPDADDSPVLRERLAQYQKSPYVQALDKGGDPEAYEVAEERLNRSLIALREEGALLAQQLDANVTRVVATLDSLRLAAHTDSTRVACGLMIDTLAITGLRADSVRSACMRADTLKIAEYLKADTMKLRQQEPGDSLRRRTAPRGSTVKRDSIKH